MAGYIKDPLRMEGRIVTYRERQELSRKMKEAKEKDRKRREINGEIPLEESDKNNSEFMAEYNKMKEKVLNGEEPLKGKYLDDPEFMTGYKERREKRLCGVIPLTDLDMKDERFMFQYNERQQLLNGKGPLGWERENPIFMAEYNRRKKILDGQELPTERDLKNEMFMAEFERRKNERLEIAKAEEEKKAKKERRTAFLQKIKESPTEKGGVYVGQKVSLTNPNELLNWDVVDDIKVERNNPSDEGAILLRRPGRRIRSGEFAAGQFIFTPRDPSRSLTQCFTDKGTAIQLTYDRKSYQILRQDTKGKWRVLQNIPVSCPKGTDPRKFAETAAEMVQYFDGMSPEKVEKYREYFKAWILDSSKIFTTGAPDRKFDGFMKVANEWEKNVEEKKTPQKAPSSATLKRVRDGR